MSDTPLLDLRGLQVDFQSADGINTVVKDVGFTINPGEIVSLVGESGSGKSVTALSLLKLIASPPGHIRAGQAMFEGQDLYQLSEAQMRRVRGNRISMIFQEPMTSLNPLMPVGRQISEVFRLHQGMNASDANKQALEMLEKVRIPNARQRMNDFPHQMSGGMRQRVMIAMALCCNPALLIADEPTTALDVTIQKEIMNLMMDLQQEYRTAVLLITHDLGVVAEVAQKMVVMYKGQVVETGSVADVFAAPKHAYTRGLIRAVPVLGNRAKFGRMRLSEIRPESLEETDAQTAPAEPAAAMPIPDSPERGEEAKTPLLTARGLKVQFGSGAKAFKAVDDVSFDIARNETLAIVGESGSGKTTTGMSICGLQALNAGEIIFDGTPREHISASSKAEQMEFARRIQIVFQDPYSSLNPRMSIGRILEEPMRLHGRSRAEASDRAVWLLEKVGLTAEHRARHAHEFSGGQRQRIGIARALALEPELIICDEAVSALDVSVQAQIINLLMDLQKELSISYLFISHDLAVVEHIADRVSVMRHGKIVEEGGWRQIFTDPQHDYTKELLAAVPRPEPRVARTA